MPKSDKPLFISVKGEVYVLETAAAEMGEENLKQRAKEIENYFANKGGGKEKVPDKEPKKTEKDLTMDPPSDKEAVQNVADKETSPPKEIYKGKESKKTEKDFQLKPDTPKEYNENAPDKMPAKIQVKGFVYERVDEPAEAPAQIRVQGYVYTRLPDAPAQIRVGGKTFVKLSDAEAREVLAKKGKSDAWDEPPKGWTKKSMTEYMKSISKGSKHQVTSCIRAIKKAKNSKIDDPEAFCASLMRKIDPEWTPRGGKGGKGKSKK